MHWPSFFIGLSIAAAVGLVVKWLFGLPFWAAFGLAVFGMVVNGFLAEWEDNQPGGFNNPH